MLAVLFVLCASGVSHAGGPRTPGTHHLRDFELRSMNREQAEALLRSYRAFGRTNKQPPPKSKFCFIAGWFSVVHQGSRITCQHPKYQYGYPGDDGCKSKDDVKCNPILFGDQPCLKIRDNAGPSLSERCAQSDPSFINTLKHINNSPDGWKRLAELGEQIESFCGQIADATEENYRLVEDQQKTCETLRKRIADLRSQIHIRVDSGEISCRYYHKAPYSENGVYEIVQNGAEVTAYELGKDGTRIPTTLFGTKKVIAYDRNSFTIDTCLGPVTFEQRGGSCLQPRFALKSRMRVNKNKAGKPEDHICEFYKPGGWFDSTIFTVGKYAALTNYLYHAENFGADREELDFYRDRWHFKGCKYDPNVPVDKPEQRYRVPARFQMDTEKQTCTLEVGLTPLSPDPIPTKPKPAPASDGSR